ncbi:MAG: FAD:protein FMN transferase [Brevundimonas sp.]
MSIDVRDATSAGAPVDVHAAVAAAFTALHDADERFSRFRPDSEISRIRRGALEATAASPDVREVLAVAERARIASGDAFRVVDPAGLLDTDGVVKGWAAQRAADLLRDAGVRSFCVNAGGDVATAGEPEPGRPWQVAVRDPFDPRGHLAILSLRDGAVATSGTYERGAHVWDGRGSHALELVAATVVASSLTDADVLATSVLVLGGDGPRWAVEHGADLVITVDHSGAVRTAGREAAPTGTG